MGPTCGKSFLFPRCRVALEDSNKDEQVGHEDDQEGLAIAGANYDAHGQLFAVGVRAGQFDQRRLSTVEMVDFIGTTGEAISL